MLKELKIRTRKRNEMIDITSELKGLIDEGILTVYTPHTTTAVTINENADPDVQDDMIGHLSDIVPREGFKHMEGNSDAHIKSSLIGASEQVIVKNGELILGTWQSVFFCEFDGPRERKVYVYGNS